MLSGADVNAQKQVLVPPVQPLRAMNGKTRVSVVGSVDAHKLEPNELATSLARAAQRAQRGACERNG